MSAFEKCLISAIKMFCLYHIDTRRSLIKEKIMIGSNIFHYQLLSTPKQSSSHYVGPQQRGGVEQEGDVLLGGASGGDLGGGSWRVIYSQDVLHREASAPQGSKPYRLHPSQTLKHPLQQIFALKLKFHNQSWTQNSRSRNSLFVCFSLFLIENKKDFMQPFIFKVCSQSVLER